MPRFFHKANTGLSALYFLKYGKSNFGLQNVISVVQKQLERKLILVNYPSKNYAREFDLSCSVTLFRSKIVQCKCSNPANFNKKVLFQSICSMSSRIYSLKISQHFDLRDGCFVVWFGSRKLNA